ncbi:hypothetical protein [Rickettsiales endosymbiont of Trichoplax sp. H2]|nr:hypothetical protein [Rickettsiales endosymbiont of Trichoplax sp. H2]
MIKGIKKINNSWIVKLIAYKVDFIVRGIYWPTDNTEINNIIKINEVFFI